MQNIRDVEFNPNVVQVYTEEPGYTGYKGFDFTKIDEIETILRSGVNVNITGATTNLTINSATVSVSNEVEVKNTDNSPIPISNPNLDLLDRILVTGDTIRTGIAVYQTALNKTLDSVSASVTGIVHIAENQSISVGTVSNLPQITIAADQNVGVNSLPAITVAAGQNVGVNSLPPVTIAADQNVGVTGPVSTAIEALKNNFSNVLFSDENSPTGVVVYQTNLNKDLDNITTYPEKSDIISNFSPSGSNGTVLGGNANRKELYIQNLHTEPLYVKYGTNASASSFNFVLAQNTANNAGDGGSVSDQSYTGVVSVFGPSSPVNYISWERV